MSRMEVKLDAPPAKPLASTVLLVPMQFLEQRSSFAAIVTLIGPVEGATLQYIPSVYRRPAIIPGGRVALDPCPRVTQTLACSKPVLKDEH